ncbi:MAG TPA: class I SAM-dependent methyltransferase [Streptosporangiaceae bacterium]|nr:class I SAM-dependent methyltransferase [Streptosporangiaceae bacterium]
MDRYTALKWIERWDRQQESGMPVREDRFTALIDALEAAIARDRTGTASDALEAASDAPVVLDIGCGPGSLAVRIKERLPHVTVIGVDTDPVTLALARAAYPDLTFQDQDLREEGWTSRLGIGSIDAAVSTTALHWLPEMDLRAFYKELTTILKPGAVLLNGDHFAVDAMQTPTLAALDRAVRDREDQRRFPHGHQDTWQGWWQEVAQDPDLAGYSAERDRRRVEAAHGSSETDQLAVHVDALTAAGFAEVGTVWQHGDLRILCAVTGGVTRSS